MCLHVVAGDLGLRDSLTVLLTLQGFVVRSHRDIASLYGTGGVADGDTVILDLDLPRGEARNFMECWKRGSASCRLIVLTGMTSGYPHVCADAEGSPIVLTKPFNAAELLALL
jgi:two-component system, LuxR family, response regulator FixJ